VRGLETCLGVERSIKGQSWRRRLTDEQAAFALSQALGVPDALARVLAGRGVAVHQARAYLNPCLRHDLPDPNRLVDMERAAARLARAVQEGEPIGLFADYDVDGATSAAVLTQFLSALGAKTRLTIPDRLKEGYGPSPQAFARLADEGLKLVLTLDCGTRAFAALEAAAARGLEVIVIDHHLPGTELPTAFALVNPNRRDDTSGLGQLCAAGVAFLLAVAVNRSLREAGFFGARGEPEFLSLLDLVALGTVCDVVPLTGLNRAFVSQGLKRLRATTNPGLAALAEVARASKTPGTYDLGFIFGPRINAGSRMGASDLGARLLTTEDPQEARRIALQLEALNRQRREIEAAVEAHAAAQAELCTKPILVLAGENWHTGVVGIVAGRLRERFNRPCLVFGIDGEPNARIAKGSGRSMKGVDLGQAVGAAEEAGLILKGGGHAMAVGLTALEAQIAGLETFLVARLGADVAAAQGASGLLIDAVIAVGGATRDLADTLDLAGPYGAGNPQPVVALSPARVTYVAPAGEQHLRLTLEGANGGRARGVAFRCVGTPLGEALASVSGKWLHVAGHLKADAWAGAAGVQLVIEDAAPA
jgi:single-stranded-DNA-specific exonuclease